MPSSTEGLLQELRDCTVEVKTADHKTSVGTGIVVSVDGKIVTCSHVVKDALDKDPRKAIGEAVGVYFRQLRGTETKVRTATVTCCFPTDFEDDIVLLELEGTMPLVQFQQ